MIRFSLFLCCCSRTLNTLIHTKQLFTRFLETQHRFHTASNTWKHENQLQNAFAPVHITININQRHSRTECSFACTQRGLYNVLKSARGADVARIGSCADRLVDRRVALDSRGGFIVFLYIQMDGWIEGGGGGGCDCGNTIAMRSQNRTRGLCSESLVDMGHSNCEIEGCEKVTVQKKCVLRSLDANRLNMRTRRPATYIERLNDRDH